MTHDTPSDGREHGPERGLDPAGGDREVIALLESAIASSTVRRERFVRAERHC